VSFAIAVARIQLDDDSAELKLVHEGRWRSSPGPDRPATGGNGRYDRLESPNLMRTLRVTSGPAAGQSIDVDRELIIGRESTTDLTIEDDEASREHASIRPVERGVAVRDLGSRNGTFVNGERISGEATMTASGTIRVGATDIAVELPVAAVEATVPRQVPPAAEAPGAPPPMLGAPTAVRPQGAPPPGAGPPPGARPPGAPPPGAGPPGPPAGAGPPGPPAGAGPPGPPAGAPGPGPPGAPGAPGPGPPGAGPPGAGPPGRPPMPLPLRLAMISGPVALVLAIVALIISLS
jgi:hypothetical protein